MKKARRRPGFLLAPRGFSPVAARRRDGRGARGAHRARGSARSPRRTPSSARRRGNRRTPWSRPCAGHLRVALRPQGPHLVDALGRGHGLELRAVGALVRRGLQGRGPRRPGAFLRGRDGQLLLQLAEALGHALLHPGAELLHARRVGAAIGTWSGRALGLRQGAEARGSDQAGGQQVTTMRFHARSFQGGGPRCRPVAAQSGPRLCLIHLASVAGA
jgi:hypothetical protein